MITSGRTNRFASAVLPLLAVEEEVEIPTAALVPASPYEIDMVFE